MVLSKRWGMQWANALNSFRARPHLLNRTLRTAEPTLLGELEP